MKGIVSILFLLLAFAADSQITPPYFQNFDSVAINFWTSYAINGTNEWQRGTPVAKFGGSAFSTPNAYVTKLQGNHSSNSVMALQTPAFDLSDTTKKFVFSFDHKREFTDNTIGKIEYSVDSGTTWYLLQDAYPHLKQRNWYVNGVGFTSYSTPISVRNSAISLNFLKGNRDVRLRFVYSSQQSVSGGWLIDNFFLSDVERYNVSAPRGDTISNVSKYFQNVTAKGPFEFENQFTQNFMNQTDFYLSQDMVFDNGDLLLGSHSFTNNGSANAQLTFAPLANLRSGLYYIFYKHDVLDSIREYDETDNMGYAVLQVDSTFAPDHTDLFEGNQYWTPKARNTQYHTPTTHNWKKGYCPHLPIEGVHSGQNAWFLDEFVPYQSTTTAYILESPYLDLSGFSSTYYFCFWYKVKKPVGYVTNFNVKLSSAPNYVTFDYSTIIPVPHQRNGDWDFFYVPLTAIQGSRNAKVRIEILAAGGPGYGINVVIDDVYIGVGKPDPAVQHSTKIFTGSHTANDTLRYRLMNAGSHSTQDIFTTNFYWSADSILDASDPLIASVSEPHLSAGTSVIRSVAYAKPTTLKGTYYVFGKLDANNVIQEMHETNNLFVYHLHQEESIELPYFNDFETDTIGWQHFASAGTDEWRWETPTGLRLNRAFSGTKVFYTKNAGSNTLNSRMHLYTPTFDFSTVNYPILEFDMLHDRSYTTTSQSALNLSYSLDGGNSWSIVDTTNQSFKGWYYPYEYNSSTGKDQLYWQPISGSMFHDTVQRAFVPSYFYLGKDILKPHRNIIDLGFLSGQKTVKFRFNVGTQQTYQNTEGSLIDNFTLANKWIDLVVKPVKQLYWSPLADKLQFVMDIRNEGNYLAGKFYIKFYLSIDSILDANDYVLGADTIPEIKPEYSFHLNALYAQLPSQFASYHYLISKLDETSQIPESNEQNNVAAWPLKPEGVRQFPYSENFNDSLVHGWTYYMYSSSGAYVKGSYRFRNQLIMGDTNSFWSFSRKAGTMFSEFIHPNQFGLAYGVPYLYLQSPSFNFEHSDSIELSFDMECVGSIYDGGNMQYSTDGGKFWKVLNPVNTAALNWYTASSLRDLNYQSGWNGPFIGCPYTLNLKPRKIDLSFLSGRSSVLFRYQYRSNFDQCGSVGINGIHIDNFKVVANIVDVDYVAKDSLKFITVNSADSILQIEYTVQNTGNNKGKNTRIRWIWSTDSVLHATDSVFAFTNDSSIAAQSVITRPTQLKYPLPINQSVYYLFYELDADTILAERSKNNNVGSMKITFAPFPYTDYVAKDSFITMSAKATDPFVRIPYHITNTGKTDGTMSKTLFYWSEDAVLDSADFRIDSSVQKAIRFFSTDTSFKDLYFPKPTRQLNYYVFYKANSNVAFPELNFQNNIGSLRVLFDQITGLRDISLVKDFSIIQFNRKLFLKPRVNLSNPIAEISIYNTAGQMIMLQNLKLYNALNKLELNEKLPSGIYMIHLLNENRSYVHRIYIQ